MKTCRACGKKMTLDNFYIRKDNGKIYSDCKKCNIAKKREWRKKNIEKHREYEKKYRKTKPEIRNAINRKYTKKNPQKVRKWQLNTKNKIESIYGIGLATIRRYGLRIAISVYDRAGRMCEQCGNENDLTIHHKDNKGRNYKEQGLNPNNSLNNLIILCRKCHGKLHSMQYWKHLKRREAINGNNDHQRRCKVA